MHKRPAGLVSDLRGGARLVVDGVHGVTGIVESMHSRIRRAPPPLGRLPEASTTGITGLVYRGIHATTGLVGKALDAALAGIEVALPGSAQPLPPGQAE